MKRLFCNIFSNKSTIVVFLAFMVIFIAMNVIVPLYTDDLYFSYRYGTHGESYTSIIQVAEDAVRSYWTDNGRVVCMFFARLYAGYMSDTAFSIVNSLMFLLLVCLIGKFSLTDSQQKSVVGWTTIFVFLFILSNGEERSTGEVNLYWWAAGAGNYVVSGVMTMTYLLLIRYLSKTHDNSIGLCICLLLSGFILAFQHEGFDFALCATTIIWLLANRNKINRALMSFVLAFMLGSIVNVLHPGLGERASGLNANNSFSIKDLLWESYFIFSSLRGIYIFLFLLVFSAVLRKVQVYQFLKDNWFLCLCLVFSMVLPFVARQQGRALYFMEFFAGLLLCRLIAGCYSEYQPIFRILAFVAFMFYGSVAVYSKKQWSVMQTVQNKYYSSNDSLVEYKPVLVPKLLQSYVVDPLFLYHYQWMRESHQLIKRYKKGYRNAGELKAYPDFFLEKSKLLDYRYGKYKYTFIYPYNRGFLVITNDTGSVVTFYSHLLFIHRVADHKLSDDNDSIRFPSRNNICWYKQSASLSFTLDSIKTKKDK